MLISHHHYDHCDLKALRAYRDPGVPMLVAGPVAARARRHGFTNVTALAPWQSAQLGSVTVTAAPAKHAVYEVTFVLSDGAHTVYFAGDTCSSPNWPSCRGGLAMSTSPCYPPMGCGSARKPTSKS